MIFILLSLRLQRLLEMYSSPSPNSVDLTEFGLPCFFFRHRRRSHRRGRPKTLRLLPMGVLRPLFPGSIPVFFIEKHSLEKFSCCGDSCKEILSA